MLKTIKIESLFGVYSYTLELKPEMKPFRFVTGPNGYGKTTVLKMLKALYTNEIKVLADIPFSMFQLLFDDGNEMTMTQKRDYVEEEDTDEQILKKVTLHVRFGKNGGENHTYVVDKNESADTTISNMSLYFQSHPVYHISDGRMFTPKGTPAVIESVRRMKEFLGTQNVATPDFNARVEAFKNIILHSGFAHKEMEISPAYGIRFVADNEDSEILPIESLSSGEQHILIQTFELLFCAPDDSLVLIDEPEMSFHMLWQVDYVKNLCEITSLRNLQCIICTHSPQIFNQDWDLTVDLYEQSSITE